MKQGGRVDGQVLAYPPLDPECAAASYLQALSPLPERQALRRAWHDHLGNIPYPSLLSADLRASPPTLLGVGEHDPVLDDVLNYAERLTQVGIPVVLQRFPNAGHALFLRQDEAFLHWLATSIKALTAVDGVK